ncbi:hypothetical protein K502DRAFT_352511 [Neoconidiobolus thromboides FSU 785]|nr:hypothetical protein K502DRAFT_352511 [Neoconidiobolus thromboides FSU 785]
MKVGKQVQGIFIGKNKYIKLLPWAQQVFVLGHKNTKLYILYGRLESTFEAIYPNTSMLCLALTADRPRNPRKIKKIGTGLYVDKVTFTSKYSKEQFETIIKDEDEDDKFKPSLFRMEAIVYYNSKKITMQLIYLSSTPIPLNCAENMSFMILILIYCLVR